MADWTRHLTIVTGVLVFVGTCQLGAGMLQWRSMQGQLDIMRSDQSGAAAQLSAAEASESDTRNLASAAADQALTASDQLVELSSSVSAAQKAADAAEKQAKEFAAVQRPFVNASNVEISSEIKLDNAGAKFKRWIIRPVITNDGYAPTEEMRLQVIAHGSIANGESASMVFLSDLPIGDGPHGYVFPPDPDDWMKNARRVFIGPHGRNSDGFVEVRDDELRSSIWSGMGFEVVGEAVYHDAFPHTPVHKSKFCYVITGIPTDKDFVPQATLCSHLNCADDDCKQDKNEYDAAVTKEPKYKYFRVTLNIAPK